MEDQIAEILQKLNAISEHFSLLQQNVDRSLATMWWALGFVVAAAGAALLVLARSWVDKAVKSKLKEMERDVEEINKNIKGDLDSRLKHLEGYTISEYGSNINGEYIRWANGLQICTGRLILETKNHLNQLSGIWVIPASFAKIHSLQVSVIDSKNNIVTNQRIVDGHFVQVFAYRLDRDYFSMYDTAEVSLTIIGDWKRNNDLKESG